MTKPNQEIDRLLNAVSVLILGVIRSHPSRAYGAAISERVNELLGADKHMESSLIYARLRYLLNEGYLKSETRPAIGTPFPRKYYSLTRRGTYWLEIFDRCLLDRREA